MKAWVPGARPLPSRSLGAHPPEFPTTIGSWRASTPAGLSQVNVLPHLRGRGNGPLTRLAVVQVPREPVWPRPERRSGQEKIGPDSVIDAQSSLLRPSGEGKPGLQ